MNAFTALFIQYCGWQDKSSQFINQTNSKNVIIFLLLMPFFPHAQSYVNSSLIPTHRFYEGSECKKEKAINTYCQENLIHLLGWE